ncbi:ABC transporter substrate-binding protein [Paenibacillus sp. GCM10027626]|uniref:ABC transporter substrate-binding protein n=1 Tax=Paenibacillus sp. GCM10027626 TaxID=3273411 RepID=UPI003631F05D
MKRIQWLEKRLAICTVIIMSLTLAACGGGDKAAGTSGNGGTASKSDLTLTLWHWKVAFDPGLKAVADAYKKKTGITVETQITTPDDSYTQKVTAAASAGNLPDIYLYWSGPTNGAFDGTAMEWSAELDKDHAWKDSFFPSALSGTVITQSQIDSYAKDEKASDWLKSRKIGQYYGIPIDVGSFYTVYGNAKLLKEAGVPAAAPATVEEWLENMNTVKEKTGVPGFVFSAKTFSVYENWMANFQDYMKNGPESFTKFMNREAKMSDPEHIQIAKFIENLTKSGNILQGSASLDIDPSDQAFAQGKAAYTIGGTFTFSSLTALGMNPDDIVSFRVPAYEGSKVPDAKVPSFPLVQAIVTDNGPHKKEAIDFVKFLTSEEGMVLYANSAFDVPAINLKDRDALKPALRAMIDSVSSETNWYSENADTSNKVFGPEWNKFHEMKQKIILGAATAEEAAKELDKAAEAEKAKQK